MTKNAKNAKITKKELLRAIQERAARLGVGLTRDETGALLEAFVLTVDEATTCGSRVPVPGLGTFTRKHRPGGFARNPKTGEQVTTAPSSNLVFRVSGAMKRTET